MTIARITDLRNSLKFIAKWEWANKADGGYTNYPYDPGGETKFGISKRAHPNEDIKGLSLEHALEIYANEYWTPAGCDVLDYPFNCVVFDSAVNCGVSRAKDWLRKSKTIADYIEFRRRHYYAIINANTSQMKYAKGWFARLADLKLLVDVAERAVL